MGLVFQFNGGQYQCELIGVDSYGEDIYLWSKWAYDKRGSQLYGSEYYNYNCECDKPIKEWIAKLGLPAVNKWTEKEKTLFKLRWS